MMLDYEDTTADKGEMGSSIKEFVVWWGRHSETK